MWVGPPWEWGVRWSRSQSVAGLRHPGKVQVRSRVSTWRRCAAVGRRLVVPLATIWPVSGWVMVGGGVGAVEQIEEDVGAELVHGAGLTPNA